MKGAAAASHIISSDLAYLFSSSSWVREDAINAFVGLVHENLDESNVLEGTIVEDTSILNTLRRHQDVGTRTELKDVSRNFALLEKLSQLERSLKSYSLRV